ncbi:putative peptide chain release factor 1 [Trypanosoma grayi]|uniref:putative peptide chain release factor 1 n=1 Tax=Trypanosoma grayi TaxID=71804 RepID=UPI0004F412A5|nr:putative peptide chain release factor 1 [Trypanosoma grayi]KEG12069.1 putative peptide chain release factor 1 [Trypanosoma grayi]
MRNARCFLFGAGGTQGGVKKVTHGGAIPYQKWLLTEGARALLAPVHHPLVTEYFIRLNQKRVELEKLHEHGEVDALRLLKNKVDGKPFDHIQWNIQYRDELDVAEEISGYLGKINDNIMLRDQIRLQEKPNKEDQDLLPMVEDDIKDLLHQIEGMDNRVNAVMARRLESGDALGSSSRTWIMEVTGKAGGEEASLFATELAEVYKTYATELKEWCVGSVEDGNDGEATASGAPAVVSTGLKFQVTGDGVYRNLRHEIGVHKVQRVPVTDQDGKMQTSTAVVTLMPVLDPVSVDVHESDCKIEFVRGSGPGGQGMQSSSNAVCLTHKPSGISVKCHQSRSALGNKELALQTVAQQLLVRRIKDQNSSLHEAWKNQWSSGERSDKMRTYNYPQNRVTDHRLGKDFPLTTFMSGGAGLMSLHDDLNAVDDRQQLIAVLLRHIEGEFGSVV